MELPAELVGQKVLSFLDLKSIVLLERALTTTKKMSTLHSFLKISPAFAGSVLIPNDASKFKWLQVRHCRITQGVINLDKLEAPFDVDVINELTLCGLDQDRNISNKIGMISNKAFEKCKKVALNGTTQDLATIVELFSRLQNMRTLITDCFIDDWFEDALNNTTSGTTLERITFNDFPTSLTTVAAIVKHCPNLLSLEVFRFADTNEALLTLSEHKLPKEFLGVSHVLPELSVEQAFLCAHALSRICRLHTYYLSHCLHSLPYLTGLRELYVGSHVDHILLPILSQHCLSLEIVRLSEYSSATVEQVVELIQSCSGTLTVLQLNHASCVESNTLATALVPHCPHLQELVFGSLMVSHPRTTMDSSVLALSWHCPQLRELNMYCHGKASEITLLQLIAACPQLQVLEVPEYTVPPYFSRRLFQRRNKKVQWGTLKPHSTIAPWVAMRIAMLKLHCCQH